MGFRGLGICENVAVSCFASLELMLRRSRDAGKPSQPSLQSSSQS